MHKWDTSPKASRMFMVLSPEPRAFQAFPTLPVELVDDIVDKACRMLDKSSVSSIALTSHSFRIRANRSRFLSLVPFRNRRSIPHTARGITTLANVIRSGQSITTMPGICTFATSFTLTITGYDYMVKPILNDGCLAFIFNNLFRPLPPSAPSLASAGGIRSLFLHISYTGRRKHARPDAVSWGAINSGLRQALKNLLLFSELNRFSVEAMCDIPRDFLQGSKIKHLSLRRVSITPTTLNCDSTTLGKSSIVLESLDVDNSISRKDIEMVTHPHVNASVSPCNTLSGLTQLSMEAVGTDTYRNLNEVLRNAPALRFLALRLSFGQRDYVLKQDSFTINYGHLEQLESIAFTVLGNAPLSLVNHLLKHGIPLSLSDLSIKIPYWACNPVWRPVIEHLQSININVLDNHLAHASFDSIRHIHIIIKVQVPGHYHSEYRTSSYLAQWCSYVRSQVPLLLEKRPEMDVRVVWKK